MEGSTRLRLRVSPGGRSGRVVGRHGEAWKVSVQAAPEHGKANDAVLSLLAETLDVPRRDLEILAGHGARDKVVSVRGLAVGEAERRLTSAARSVT